MMMRKLKCAEMCCNCAAVCWCRIILQHYCITFAAHLQYMYSNVLLQYMCCYVPQMCCKYTISAHVYFCYFRPWKNSWNLKTLEDWKVSLADCIDLTRFLQIHLTDYFYLFFAIFSSDLHLVSFVITKTSQQQTCLFLACGEKRPTWHEF